MKLNFHERTHTYSFGQLFLVSVTTFLKEFAQPFDSDKWSKYVAKRDKKTQEQVLKEWKEKADTSCRVGTNVHKYAENRARIQKGEKVLQIKPKDEREKLRMSAVEKFWADHSNLTPHLMEQQLYNLKYRLAGTVDYVARCDEGKYYIVDWKTNKSIDVINRYGGFMKAPLEHLDDCNYNHYGLQLSLYKFMVEAQLKINIAGMYLIHLGKESYKQYEVAYMEGEVEDILKVRLGQIEKAN